MGDGIRDAGRVDADCGHRRNRWIARFRPDCLRAERRHFAWRVRSLESRQVHASHRQVERPELGGLLDRALGERGGALVDAYLVDAAHAAHQRAEVREGEGGSHHWDYATGPTY